MILHSIAVSQWRMARPEMENETPQIHSILSSILIRSTQGLSFHVESDFRYPPSVVLTRWTRIAHFLCAMQQRRRSTKRCYTDYSMTDVAHAEVERLNNKQITDACESACRSRPTNARTSRVMCPLIGSILSACAGEVTMESV